MSHDRLESYYFRFQPTNVEQIDRVLAAVASAGRICHDTSDWNDAERHHTHDGESPVAWIQHAANQAAEFVKAEAADAVRMSDEAGKGIALLESQRDEALSSAGKLRAENMTLRADNLSFRDRCDAIATERHAWQQKALALEECRAKDLLDLDAIRDSFRVVSDRVGALIDENIKLQKALTEAEKRAGDAREKAFRDIARLLKIMMGPEIYSEFTAILAVGSLLAPPDATPENSRL